MGAKQSMGNRTAKEQMVQSTADMVPELLAQSIIGSGKNVSWPASRASSPATSALAIMSNHVHLVLRNRPDLAGQWTDQEVARRWWNVFPQRKNEDGSPAEPEPHELDLLRADPAALQERRQRLSSLSWFMRCLAD